VEEMGMHPQKSFNIVSFTDAPGLSFLRELWHPHVSATGMKFR
jgi:hypothetical protein